MEAIDCIMTRRSIRKYQDKPVPEETIKKILEAGMMAPSAGDQRPWHFIVVKDKKILEEASHVYRYHAMVKGAAFAILVCGDPSKERHSGYWVQDCSNATMNLLLAAHALGLGAVWTGVHPRKDREDAFRAIFKTPEGIIPFALIPFGFPAEMPSAKGRYDEKLVHKERW